MTREHVDAEMETDFAMETESIRTAEKYTSITKDTGKYIYVQLNFNGSNTFGTMKLSSGQG